MESEIEAVEKCELEKSLAQSVVSGLLSRDFNNPTDVSVVKRFPGEAGTAFK